MTLAAKLYFDAMSKIGESAAESPVSKELGKFSTLCLKIQIRVSLNNHASVRVFIVLWSEMHGDRLLSQVSRPCSQQPICISGLSGIHSDWQKYHVIEPLSARLLISSKTAN